MSRLHVDQEYESIYDQSHYDSFKSPFPLWLITAQSEIIKKYSLNVTKEIQPKSYGKNTILL